VIWRHATLSSNRESIREHGLLARATAEHNYPDSDDFTKCVCLTSRENGRPSVWWEDNPEIDVWDVDITGLPFEDDPSMDGDGIRVLCDIPPERLTLVRTVELEDALEVAQD
jgi:hypothetical protein